MKVLADLGLLPELDRAGIRTRDLIYANRFGQPVWRELRGTAGYDVPQLSIHRGKLHGVLVRAALERLGAQCVHTGCTVVGFAERRDRVVARIKRRETQDILEASGDAPRTRSIRMKARSRIPPEPVVAIAADRAGSPVSLR